MKLLFNTIAKALGKNPTFVPSDVIIDQMNEKRPLPIGMDEFEEWSERIIAGSLLPAEGDSMKFALASMLMHLSPTQDHETDGYFIKALRKSAVNQIAHAKMQELKEKAKAKLETQKSELTLVDENHA